MVATVRSKKRTADGDVVLAAVVLHDGDVVGDAHERLVLVGLLENFEEVSGRRRPAAGRPCKDKRVQLAITMCRWTRPGFALLGQRHGHGQGDALEEGCDVRHEADLMLQLVRHLTAIRIRALKTGRRGVSARSWAVAKR